MLPVQAKGSKALGSVKLYAESTGGRRPELKQPGVIYLCGPGLLEWSKGERSFLLRRPCLLPGLRFKVQLRFAGRDPKVEAAVVGALWLAAVFGGLGARTRRGFGGVVLGGQGLPVLRPDRLVEDLRAALGAIRDDYCSLAAVGGRDQSEGQPQFSCFAEGQYRVLAAKGLKWTDGYAVLDSLGRFLRLFRIQSGGTDLRERGRDYRDVISPFFGKIRSEPSATIRGNALRNLALGLPYIIQSSSRRMTAIVEARTPAGGADSHRERERPVRRDRRASPVVLRPVRAGGRWFAVALVFRADFLPDGMEYRLLYQAEQKSLLLRPPNPAVLDEFEREFRGTAAHQFVGEIP